MGVDQDYNAIEEAKKNTKYVTYLHDNIASCTFNTQFDCIVLSEVIEHIKDRFLALSHLSQFLKEDGIMIISTLNKTWQSYVGAILCAEHLLRFVPRGTHDWHDFMKPSELEHDLKENNLKMINIKGMYYNFLTKNWKWCSSLKMNYIIAAQKNRLNLLENKAI
jgi:ubiquinone biosynthesis O-methyltransferase